MYVSLTHIIFIYFFIYKYYIYINYILYNYIYYILYNKYANGVYTYMYTYAAVCTRTCTTYSKPERQGLFLLKIAAPSSILCLEYFCHNGILFFFTCSIRRASELLKIPINIFL